MRGHSPGYPAYPEITAQLGYNPARFLDVPVRKNGCTKELSANALIRGIDGIETIRAWLTIEADLGRGRNGGPRQRVVKWLNRRQSQIEEADRASSTGTDEGNQQASQLAEPAKADKLDEPSKPSERSDSSEQFESGETVGNPGNEESIDDPRCPTCGERLTPEQIAGQLGYWCYECRDFREPATEPSPSVASTAIATTDASAATAVATDGGAPDPDTLPRCPDCHGELPEETVDGDEAAWCAYCGSLKPLGESA